MTKKATGRLEGNDLVLTRHFDAPIEDVWTSITNSERTAQWYGSWKGTPGAGNTVIITMVLEKGEPSSEAHIDACEPPYRLALTTKGEWGVQVEITLAQVVSGTELRFVHHLPDRKHAGDYGPGWEYYLDNLLAARAGLKLPAFEEYYPSMKAHYTAE